MDLSKEELIAILKCLEDAGVEPELQYAIANEIENPRVRCSIPHRVTSFNV